MGSEKYLIRSSEGLRKASAYVANLPMHEGVCYELAVNRVTVDKTASQIAYLHVAFRLISDSSGHSEKEIKSYMKDEFLTKRTMILGDAVLTRTPSLSELSVDEMSTFIDDVLNFAAEELDINLERPEDLERIA